HRAARGHADRRAQPRADQRARLGRRAARRAQPRLARRLRSRRHRHARARHRHRARGQRRRPATAGSGRARSQPRRGRDLRVWSRRRPGHLARALAAGDRRARAVQGGHLALASAAMFEDRDRRTTAWGWLRGFAYFLLAWPLFSLLALDQFDLDDWQSIVLAVFGPAAIGLVLLGLERGLTRLLGGRSKRRQPVPSTLRDLSNLGLAMAILLVIDVAIVTIADDEQIVTGGDPQTAKFALMMLGICVGVTLIFR